MPEQKEGHLMSNAPSHPRANTLVSARRDPFTGAQIRIGVMGSASDIEPEVADACRRLGRAVASRGICLLTGACPGAPHEVVLAAKAAGGHVVGVSPATSLKEHVDLYGSPYREYDVLIFTGLGLMGRELINIYSSDIVIVVSGRSGTLGEFAIAYEQGKLIGVLAGTGGITTVLPVLEASFNKRTGSEVVYDPDPDRLVDHLLTRFTSPQYSCSCYPADSRLKAHVGDSAGPQAVPHNGETTPSS
jgi:uncharacterized protein (TIGR00725 family)